MDKEFLAAAGTAFGGIAGLSVLVATFYTGRKVGKVESAVAATSKIASETRDAVRLLGDHVNGRLGKMEFAVWGLGEDNGMRSEIRDHRERLEELEKGRAE